MMTSSPSPISIPRAIASIVCTFVAGFAVGATLPGRAVPPEPLTAEEQASRTAAYFPVLARLGGRLGCADSES